MNKRKFKQLVTKVVNTINAENWTYEDTAKFIRVIREKTGLRPKTSTKYPRIPTIEECEKIYAVIRDMSNFLPRRKNYTSLDIFQAIQLSIFFQLLEVTGLRVSEAAKIRKEDIDLDERLITVRQGKGGKDRIVVFPKSFAEKFQNYLEKVKGEYVFGNPRRNQPYSTRFFERNCLKIQKIANISTKPTPHTFRHIFLTKIAKVNPIYAQKLAGHSHIDTTMVYTHLNMEDVKKAYDQAIS